MIVLAGLIVYVLPVVAILWLFGKGMMALVDASEKKKQSKKDYVKYHRK